MANAAPYRDPNFGDKINVLDQACGRYMRPDARTHMALAAAIKVTPENLADMKMGQAAVSDAQLTALAQHHTVSAKYVPAFLDVMKGSDAQGVKDFFKKAGDQVSSNRLPYFNGPVTVARTTRHGPLLPISAPAVKG